MTESPLVLRELSSQTCLKEREPHARPHQQGCLYKTDSVSAALRVCYYKHMLQSPSVTDSSATPWMAPTQNIKHKTYCLQSSVDRNSLPWSILTLIFFLVIYRTNSVKVLLLINHEDGIQGVGVATRPQSSHQLAICTHLSYCIVH